MIALKFHEDKPIQFFVLRSNAMENVDRKEELRYLFWNRYDIIS